MLTNTIKLQSGLGLSLSQRIMPASASISSMMAGTTSSQFTRGKRTKSKLTMSQGTQRVVGQLSVMSAARKQPLRLKLTNEDLVRHQVVHNAWAMLQKQKRQVREEKLTKQFEAMQSAMEDLKHGVEDGGVLFGFGSKFEKTKKRVSLELRVPTEYPPNQVWNHKYSKSD